MRTWLIVVSILCGLAFVFTFWKAFAAESQASLALTQSGVADPPHRESDSPDISFIDSTSPTCSLADTGHGGLLYQLELHVRHCQHVAVHHQHDRGDQRRAAVVQLRIFPNRDVHSRRLSTPPGSGSTAACPGRPRRGWEKLTRTPSGRVRPGDWEPPTTARSPAPGTSSTATCRSSGNKGKIITKMKVRGRLPADLHFCFLAVIRCSSRECIMDFTYRFYRK